MYPDPSRFSHPACAEDRIARELATIEDLLAAKRGGDELARGPAIPVIDAFLDRELQRLECVANSLPSKQPPDDEGLGALLRRFVYRT